MKFITFAIFAIVTMKLDVSQALPNCPTAYAQVGEFRFEPNLGFEVAPPDFLVNFEGEVRQLAEGQWSGGKIYRVSPRDGEPYVAKTAFDVADQRCDQRSMDWLRRHANLGADVRVAQTELLISHPGVMKIENVVGVDLETAIRRRLLKPAEEARYVAAYKGALRSIETKIREAFKDQARFGGLQETGAMDGRMPVLFYPSLGTGDDKIHFNLKPSDFLVPADGGALRLADPY